MAADEAVKTAQITLIEVRLARALGGKAFALFTGEVSAVRAAINAAVKGSIYSPSTNKFT